MKRLVCGAAVVLMVIMGMVLQAEAGIIGVNNEELSALLRKGVPIIDIRTEAEWRQSGVVPGSHLLTLFDDARRVVDPEGWLKKVKKLVPPDKPVILICRSGNRTAPAARFLSESGYITVYNVTNGIIPWIRDGLPLVKYPVQ